MSLLQVNLFITSNSNKVIHCIILLIQTLLENLILDKHMSVTRKVVGMLIDTSVIAVNGKNDSKAERINMEIMAKLVDGAAGRDKDSYAVHAASVLKSKANPGVYQPEPVNSRIGNSHV